MCSVTENTKKRYRYYLGEFCAFSKISPRELLLLAKSDKMGAKKKLGEFYEEYVRKGYAPNTCRNVAMTIRSFLHYNELDFGKFPLGVRYDSQYESRRIFGRQEVFRMLVGARNPRHRALISFVLQSGQRVGVITKIRYCDVRRQIENSINPVVIDVKPDMSKNGVRHSFAIGQECVDFIKIMMSHREQAGEPIDGESILFRSMSAGWLKVGNKLTRGGAARSDERGKPLDTTAIAGIMRNAADAGGVPLAHADPRPNFPHWNRFELHPHAFRRWWKNMMRRGGVTDPLLLDFMLGHKPPYRGAYDSYDHDYIRQEYSKAEPHVTFLRNRSDLVQGRQETSFQRIVDEREATALFSEGWRFVTTLPSGRLVVQRDPSPRAVIA